MTLSAVWRRHIFIYLSPYTYIPTHSVHTYLCIYDEVIETTVNRRRVDDDFRCRFGTVSCTGGIFRYHHYRYYQPFGRNIGDASRSA